jgi:hypothetical protein
MLSKLTWTVAEKLQARLYYTFKINAVRKKACLTNNLEIYLRAAKLP